MPAEARPPGPAPRVTSRLAVLDGLRLVAATMVVFYHYVGVPNANIGHQGRTNVLAWGTSAVNVFPHLVQQMATYGWTGVELFFMISGFVICMSGWGRRPADFFVSRVARIVPGYWTATVLTAAVLIAFPRLTSGVRPSMVLAHLTMVQSAYGVPNLVPAYWTLLVELASVVATRRLDGIRWRWLTVAGALTYPLYLIHQDIGFAVFAYLRGDVPAPVLVVATYAVMLGLAWLIHRGVERPVAPVLRRRLTDAVARVRLAGSQPALAGSQPALAGPAPGPLLASGVPGAIRD